MKKCPKCGSKRVALISYGLPPVDIELGKMDEKIAEKIKNEEIVLGGCIKPDIPPKFYCYNCKTKFGTPPILITKYGEEDYRDIVISVRFSDGGYFGGYDNVYIKKEKKEITVDVHTADISIVPPEEGANYHNTITENRWSRLLNRLFCVLFVHEWKKRYVDLGVCDGEQWGLEIHMTHGRVRNYYGCNDFPAYWNELKRTFKPFLAKVKNEIIIEPPQPFPDFDDL